MRNVDLVYVLYNALTNQVGLCYHSCNPCTTYVYVHFPEYWIVVVVVVVVVLYLCFYLVTCFVGYPL